MAVSHQVQRFISIKKKKKKKEVLTTSLWYRETPNWLKAHQISVQTLSATHIAVMGRKSTYFLKRDELIRCSLEFFG